MYIWIPKRLYGWLMHRAAARPYFHLPGYMRRYWLIGGSARDDRPDDELGWKRHWFDALIGRFVAARIHVTLRSDAERHMHDHPWWSVSVILDGHYWERVPKVQQQPPALDDTLCHDRLRIKGDMVFRRARSRHRLLLSCQAASYLPVVSLFIMGRKRRSWGFHTPDGFVPWRRYRDYLADNPGQFGAGAECHD